MLQPDVITTIFLEELATIDMDATTYMRRAATSVCYSHMWDMAYVNVVYLSMNHAVSSHSSMLL